MLYRDADNTRLLLNTNTGALRVAPWICTRTDAGLAYFVNLDTGVTRWIPPLGWMKGWLGRTYRLRGDTGGIPSCPRRYLDSASQFRWIQNRSNDRMYRWRPWSGLGALEVATRLCVEGAAPYLYEMRQGAPQYPPDQDDTEFTYPEAICERLFDERRDEFGDVVRVRRDVPMEPRKDILQMD